VPKNTGKASRSEWVSTADAVQGISTHLGCDLESAAEILISFSKGRDVEVRCSSFIVDLGDPLYQPDQTGLPSWRIISPVEWRELVTNLASPSDFEWTRGRLKSTDSQNHFEDGLQLEEIRSIIIVGNIEFGRADLQAIMVPSKSGSGGKPYGAFWPKLAEETIVYLHECGTPQESGISQSRAINEILDRLAQIELDPPSGSTVQSLLVALSKRLLVETRS
jgi:hypothetical protein